MMKGKQKMSKYKFFLDEQSTVWYRAIVEIEAESENEALDIVTQKLQDGDVGDWVELEDTMFGSGQVEIRKQESEDEIGDVIKIVNLLED